MLDILRSSFFPKVESQVPFFVLCSNHSLDCCKTEQEQSLPVVMQLHRIAWVDFGCLRYEIPKCCRCRIDQSKQVNSSEANENDNQESAVHAATFGWNPSKYHQAYNFLLLSVTCCCLPQTVSKWGKAKPAVQQTVGRIHYEILLFACQETTAAAERSSEKPTMQMWTACAVVDVVVLVGLQLYCLWQERNRRLAMHLQSTYCLV